MINVNHDSESLAEKYDKISKYQYINGLALVNKLNISSRHQGVGRGMWHWASHIKTGR